MSSAVISEDTGAVGSLSLRERIRVGAEGSEHFRNNNSAESVEQLRSSAGAESAEGFRGHAETEKAAVSPVESSRREKFLAFSNSAAVPILLVVVWQALGSAGLINELFLPSPAKVIRAMGEMAQDGTLFSDIWYSGVRVFWGCVWGIALGLGLGVLSGLFRPVARVLEPIIDAIRQISVYAWIPLIILWFGIGETSKIVVVFRSVLIPVYMNTLSGIRNVSKDYRELGEVLELSKGSYIRNIILPSAAPSIFTGLRLSVGNAWQAVVAAEMLGGLTGLGYALLHAKDYMRSDQLIALMVVIAVIGMVLDKILRVLEKRIFRWKEA